LADDGAMMAIDKQEKFANGVQIFMQHFLQLQLELACVYKNSM
jgi:hypothetical protein